MKKALFIFFALISITTQAQVANGTETKQNAFRSMNPQTATTVNYLTTMGTDGTMGRVTPVNVTIPTVPLNYTVLTPTLGAHLSGIDTRLGQISSTTAGLTQRIYFTADDTTVNSVVYFASNSTGKGATAAGSPPALVLADNTKGYFTKDLISIPQPAATIGYAGSYSGNLTVSATPTPVATRQRFTVEVYRTNNLGTPIASGVSGAPVGDLGVTVIAILDSGELNINAGSITNVAVNGILTQNITLNTGERLRYHVSAAKIGAGGGNVTFGVYYGSSYNSYYDVPVAIRTNAVLNDSGVTGVTATDALNTLNTGKENTINKQNSLDIDGTGTKYPTIDIINSGVAKLNGVKKINTAQIDNENGNLGQLSHPNLVSYTTFTSGMQVNWTNGDLQANVNAKSTDYIPITAGLKYRYLCTSGFLGEIDGAFYDNNNVFISGIHITTGVDDLITAPAGATKVRLTYPASAALNRDFFYQSYKFSSYGDSITAQNQWQPLLSNYLGLFHVNVGYGGAPMAGSGTGALNQDTRLNTIPIDSDVVTVLAGTNDWLTGYPLGTENSTDVTTFYGALNSAYSKIKLRCPNATIIALCTTYGIAPTDFPGSGGVLNGLGLSTTDYANAVKIAAKNNNIRFVRTDNLWDSNSVGFFTVSDGANIHPNSGGGEILASKISLDMVQDMLNIRAKEINNRYVTGTGTSGQVSFWNGSNTQLGDSGLFWDNVNKRLGIGITPDTQLQINGVVKSNLGFRINNGKEWRSFLSGNDYIIGETGISDNLILKEGGVVNISNLSGTGTRTVVADASGNLSATASSTSSTGTYTPTFSVLNNCTSVNSTGQECVWTKIGNTYTVTVFGQLTVTTAGVQTGFTLSLPANRATSSLRNLGSGSSFGGASTIPIHVLSSSASTATVVMYPASTGTYDFSISFTYTN